MAISAALASSGISSVVVNVLPFGASQWAQRTSTRVRKRTEARRA